MDRCFFPQKWADGGLTNSLPILPGGRTVTISPFSGRLDISPQDKGQLELYVRIANQHITVSNNIRPYLKSPDLLKFSACSRNFGSSHIILCTGCIFSVVHVSALHMCHVCRPEHMQTGSERFCYGLITARGWSVSRFFTSFLGP